MPSTVAETKRVYFTASLSDDDDMPEQVFRVPRRTPVACQFCRGRKLKCDGRNICSNCVRRSLACSYVPVSKN